MSSLALFKSRTAHWKIKRDMREQIKQSKQCKIVLDYYDGIKKRESQRSKLISLELGLSCHKG